MVIIENPRNPF